MKKKLDCSDQKCCIRHTVSRRQPRSGSILTKTTTNIEDRNWKWVRDFKCLNDDSKLPFHSVSCLGRLKKSQSSTPLSPWNVKSTHGRVQTSLYSMSHCLLVVQKNKQQHSILHLKISLAILYVSVWKCVISSSALGLVSTSVGADLANTLLLGTFFFHLFLLVEG